MKATMISFLTVLMLGASCFGQDTTTHGFTTITGAGTSSAATLAWNTPSDTVWCCASSGSGWVSSNAGLNETRKLDNKGPTLAEVRYSAHQLRRSEIAPANYATLAKSIGITTSEDEAEMLQLIHDQGLKVYDFAKVDAYLYRQALKQGANMHWVWKPMREADVQAVSSAGAAYHNFPEAGLVYGSLYTQRLPIEVLTLAKNVLDAMPEAVFVVSDYAVIKPDPFLAITTRRLLAKGQMWIVYQWDEPGFTDGNALEARK